MASSSKTTRPTPITVGLICSCSSAFGASVVTQVEVYKTAIAYIDAHGGATAIRSRSLRRMMRVRRLPR